MILSLIHNLKNYLFSTWIALFSCCCSAEHNIELHLLVNRSTTTIMSRVSEIVCRNTFIDHKQYDIPKHRHGMQIVNSHCIIIPFCLSFATIFYWTYSCCVSWTSPDVRCAYSRYYMKGIVQLLRLVLSEKPHRVDVSLRSPEDRSNFRNIVYDSI
jgi:hypothetical protein